MKTITVSEEEFEKLYSVLLDIAEESYETSPWMVETAKSMLEKLDKEVNE